MTAEFQLTDWSFASAPAGLLATPADVAAATLEWRAMSVPGTVGATLLAAGRELASTDLDDADWWFRYQLPSLGGGPWLLRFDGIATVADIWLDNRHLTRSANMFVPISVDLGELNPSGAVLAVRCAAFVGEESAPRRPRPRWKTRLVADQSLRWRRTTMLGRIPGWSPGPAPVGLWRGVSLSARPVVQILDRRLVARCDGDDGVVELRARVVGDVAADADAEVVLEVGGVQAVMTAAAQAGGLVVNGTVRVPDVERWWPHTHGGQPSYDVGLHVNGERVELARVGFRTIDADRSADGFELRVNGVPIFVRGACWLPIEESTLASPREPTLAALRAARDAGLNLVRVTGVGVYPDTDLITACDEFGLLVWQDLMLANLDPPEDEAFDSEVLREVDLLGDLWSGHPSLAVVCGSSETAQQATYFGLPAERRRLPLLDVAVPSRLDAVLPDVPYLSSTPSGGALATRLRSGVSHYFGVGAYLRPLDDVRRAGVRFAAECLAFATPSELATPSDVGSDRWLRGTPADSLADWGERWDFSDVTDFYVAKIYNVDASQLRRDDPRRWLALSRAAVCEAMSVVFADWRRPGSACAGGIVLTLRDLVPGPGWGLLDSTGGAKAPWFGLRRLLAPIAVFATDEGLDGIALHAVNDGAEPLRAELRVEVMSELGHVTDSATLAIEIAARGGLSWDVEALIDGFRDLNGAHRFGPRPTGSLVAALVAADGGELASMVWPLGGPGGAVSDIGLAATVAQDDRGWALSVSAELFAERVHFELPGWRASDAWFHLPGGGSHVVRLVPDPDPDPDPGVSGPPDGAVWAVNAASPAPVTSPSATKLTE